MKITLKPEAIKWFEEKFPLHEGEAIRFFGKTYGSTEVHEGFSVGMQMDTPGNHDEILAVTEENSRQYFTTKKDEWFFEGYDLEIGIDGTYKEPYYHFIDQQNPNKKTDAVSGASEK